MIIYFSSTGNCRHIARRLAAEWGDTAISLSETDRIHLTKDEKLGFVFPTYFWRLPSVVDDYMNRLTVTAEDTHPYIFFVATYGTTCGQTGTFMKRHLRAKGMHLTAAFSIKTVDDWTVLFDVNDTDSVQSLLERERLQTEDIIDHIRVGHTGNHMRATLPMIAVMGSGIFYNRARKTKHLHVLESCIGCKRCESECPVQAIRVLNGQPTWVKDSCAMCLHCLHSCPQFAIQYDNKTQSHGQYGHP